ncbi:MAG: adenosylcobinamide-GDP ribazoletransferase [Candidatus Firestonebacteria bacterium]
MRNFLIALQFLTRIPVKIQREIKESDLVNSVVFFPLAGLILGLILVGTNFILSLFLPSFASLLLTFAVYLLLTGCMHLDGFADTIDGLYGGKTKEEIFKIMDDSHLGAMGAVWLFIILILKVFLLVNFNISNLNIAFILMPVLSRTGIILQMFFAPPAKNNGLGSIFCKKVPFKQLIMAIGFSFLISLLVGLNGIFAFLITTVISILIALYFVKKIGGITGDIFGFTVEIIEICVLIILSLKL